MYTKCISYIFTIGLYPRKGEGGNSKFLFQVKTYLIIFSNFIIKRTKFDHFTDDAFVLSVKTKITNIKVSHKKPNQEKPREENPHE